MSETTPEQRDPEQDQPGELEQEAAAVPEVEQSDAADSSLPDPIGEEQVAPEGGATASRPTPGPTPGPRPGAPRPGAGSRPGGARPPTPTPAAPTSDPSRFGRVDDDGTVWLRTAEGERQVGSWQAGTPAEGLAHYGRRYDDLATEVSILERRVASGSGDARATHDAAGVLAQGLPTAAVVGDVDGLAARLQAVVEGSEGAVTAAKERKDAARVAQAGRKEALAVEAEEIGNESTQWKVAGDRLREILEEWKTIRGLDRKTDDALWKRYSKAREAFNRRRGAHFAELDRDRATARTRKEELVAQAQELAGSSDFGPTAGRFRDLMTEWKAAGRAPREADDTLWADFKAAQDRFFAARNAASAEKDTELVANAETKAALLVEAEAVDPVGGLDQAKAALRRVQERWDEVGRVPREQVQTLEARMRAVEQKVRDADEARWKRADPEAEARAAQFRERVYSFEEQAAKARTAGNEKRAAEADAQAEQWREWATAAEGAVTG